jgi:uncharacterized membrane protein
MPDRGPARVERARTLTLLLLCSLLALSAFAVLRDPSGVAGTVLFGAFLVAPLLLPLGGIVRRRRRVYAWATLCVAPHFVYALTELVANPALRGLSVAMLFVSLGLVVALIAYLRLTRREAT